MANKLVKIELVLWEINGNSHKNHAPIQKKFTTTDNNGKTVYKNRAKAFKEIFEWMLDQGLAGTDWKRYIVELGTIAMTYELENLGKAKQQLEQLKTEVSQK